MPRRCALGCPPSTGATHIFPSPKAFPEQFRLWVEVATGRPGTDSDYEYFRNQRICDKHFTQKDRNRYGRLNALAVPSLYLNGNHIATNNSSNIHKDVQPIPVTQTEYPSQSTEFKEKNDIKPAFLNLNQSTSTNQLSGANVPQNYFIASGKIYVCDQEIKMEVGEESQSTQIEVNQVTPKTITATPLLNQQVLTNNKRLLIIKPIFPIKKKKVYVHSNALKNEQKTQTCNPVLDQGKPITNQEMTVKKLLPIHTYSKVARTINIQVPDISQEIPKNDEMPKFILGVPNDQKEKAFDQKLPTANVYRENIPQKQGPTRFDLSQSSDEDECECYSCFINEILSENENIKMCTCKDCLYKSKHKNCYESLPSLVFKPPAQHNQSNNSKEKIITKMNLSNLCPQSRQLYEETKKLRTELRNVKRKLLHKKKTSKITLEKCFERVTKRLNENAKLFFWRQMQLSKCKERGRRFDEADTQFASDILTLSPACYGYLSHFFVLPKRGRLKSMITKQKENAVSNSNTIEASMNENSPVQDFNKDTEKYMVDYEEHIAMNDEEICEEECILQELEINEHNASVDYVL